MSDSGWDTEFQNRVAQFIDATDEGLEALQHEVGTVWFAELSKYVWTREPYVRRRLRILKARIRRENH